MSEHTTQNTLGHTRDPPTHTHTQTHSTHPNAHNYTCGVRLPHHTIVPHHRPSACTHLWSTNPHPRVPRLVTFIILLDSTSIFTTLHSVPFSSLSFLASPNSSNKNTSKCDFSPGPQTGGLQKLWHRLVRPRATAIPIHYHIHPGHAAGLCEMALAYFCTCACVTSSRQYTAPALQPAPYRRYSNQAQRTSLNRYRTRVGHCGMRGVCVWTD